MSTARSWFLEVGKGRIVRILEQRYVDVSQGMVYQVEDSGRVVQPLWCFDNLDPDAPRPVYEAILSADAELVGVIDRLHPHIILILHDFKCGESWPACTPSDTYMECRARGDNMLERLQASHPTVEYKLSDR